MNLKNSYNDNLEKVYQCIEYYLGINVRDVYIEYLNILDFYRCLKSNHNLPIDLYEHTEFVKDLFINFCSSIPGMYKKKERHVIIRDDSRDDYCLLLAELIHSKSITQYHQEIEPWIHEGLPHFLAKVLSEKCQISCKNIKSEWEKFFVIWELIYIKNNYNFKILKDIIFTQHIKITKILLKRIFQYGKNDILTLPFEKAIEMID